MRVLLILFFLFSLAQAQKIKDVANIVGIRENQLIGYGLVVGLAGTGDKSQFTMQSLQNLLRNSYIKIPSSSISSKNIAAVMVTSKLPAFARQGDKIRLKVSAIGDAKSIDNGQLLLTQLKGVDGDVYALAQGTIIADDNNLTTGYIYDGATIENELDFSLQDEKNVTLSLLQNSAKNADLIETKINERFGQPLARALDTRTVDVIKPNNLSIVKFISMIEEIELDKEIFKKKIIIDMNKEIIVTGHEIIVKPITISRNNFSIRIKQLDLNEDQWNDRQINPGQKVDEGVVIADKPVVEIDNAMINTRQQPTISDVVRSMKVMKLPISDIIETIKMLRDLGAIDADIEIRG